MHLAYPADLEAITRMGEQVRVWPRAEYHTYGLPLCLSEVVKGICLSSRKLTSRGGCSVVYKHLDLSFHGTHEIPRGTTSLRTPMQKPPTMGRGPWLRMMGTAVRLEVVWPMDRHGSAGSPTRSQLNEPCYFPCSCCRCRRGCGLRPPTSPGDEMDQCHLVLFITE